MKRAPELRMLSEDHHHGLVHARRLRRAAEGDEAHPAEKTAREFLDFWQRDTSVHFRKEEEVMLPVMARYGADLEHEGVVEMLVDHAHIRGLVMRLSDEIAGPGAEATTLREIGERLESHIRLEERVVFPLVEDALPQTGLEEIAARLEVAASPAAAEPWLPGEPSYAPWPGPGDSEGGGSD
ncbi:MAG: hemerythrin domain-containing protein [Actinomycetota bacterium]